MENGCGEWGLIGRFHNFGPAFEPKPYHGLGADARNVGRGHQADSAWSVSITPAWGAFHTSDLIF